MDPYVLYIPWSLMWTALVLIFDLLTFDLYNACPLNLVNYAVHKIQNVKFYRSRNFAYFNYLDGAWLTSYIWHYYGHPYCSPNHDIL